MDKSNSQQWHDCYWTACSHGTLCKALSYTRHYQSQNDQDLATYGPSITL